jgi:hypothetical protein
VHGGRCESPDAMLERLLDRMVRTPRDLRPTTTTP